MSRIVILGAAESGVGAAILAKQKGFDVFVSDMGQIKDSYKAQLDAHQLAWEEGQHTPELILSADEVIKSPGIPETAAMVKAVRERHIPVISEIEFAGRYTTAQMIGITGSNGKTTTTSLIYHILVKAGYNVGLAGNIGRSLALQIAEGKTFDYYVLELSSFQLDDMFRFRVNVAVLLNITPDHLDRYDYQMSLYTRSKMRILQNQTPTDTFIYWHNDPIVTAQLPHYAHAAQRLAFDEQYDDRLAGTCTDTSLTLPTFGFAMPIEQISIKGKHNLRNALSAALAAKAVGVSNDTLAVALADFPGVEHRLERVAVVDDVLYINDSKATNVDACYCALDSMTTPTVLIIGGTDKGNDYNDIKALVLEKCRALVFLGADNRKLIDFFTPLGVLYVSTDNMKDCVATCHRLAQPGDTVLLSPCCASFDLFQNMADRGRQFKANVRCLTE